MPNPQNPCQAACSTGTEEECTTCLLSQYAAGCAAQTEAVELAERRGLLTAAEHNLLIRYIEDGEVLFRLLMQLHGGAPADASALAGTDDPAGGAD